MSDKIIKRLMNDFGMPDSTALYQTFKQFENEIGHELKAQREHCDQLTAQLNSQVLKIQDLEATNRGLVMAIEHQGKSAPSKIFWEEIAREYLKNSNYYHSLLVKIGETIGDDAYICDDESVSETVLCAKLPEIIKAKYAELEQQAIESQAVPVAWAAIGPGGNLQGLRANRGTELSQNWQPLYLHPPTSKANSLEITNSSERFGENNQLISQLSQENAELRAKLLLAANKAPAAALETWSPKLIDRADGCKGHYAIGRLHKLGYMEYWNLRSNRWASCSDDVLTFEQADNLLQSMQPAAVPDWIRQLIDKFMMDTMSDDCITDKSYPLNYQQMSSLVHWVRAMLAASPA